jgi:hypothetical protein
MFAIDYEEGYCSPTNADACIVSLCMVLTALSISSLLLPMAQAQLCKNTPATAGVYLQEFSNIAKRDIF